ncbi:MAG: VCBS repeat-containing protein [Caldilineaceae bacterium]
MVPIKQRNQLYRNDKGRLTNRAVWSSAEAVSTAHVTWGDVDNDGDLDLLTANIGDANTLYLNGRVPQSPPTLPVIQYGLAHARVTAMSIHLTSYGKGRLLAILLPDTSLQRGATHYRLFLARWRRPLATSHSHSQHGAH